MLKSALVRPQIWRSAACRQQRMQMRFKTSSTKPADAPPTISRRRKVQAQPAKSTGKQEQVYAYGLAPVDYSVPPPIAPKLLPPPAKRGLQQFIAPITMAMLFGMGIYLYFNSDPEMYDYWKKVESGAILIDDDDDDDDDD